jgi:hypothetical protein
VKTEEDAMRCAKVREALQEENVREREKTSGVIQV